MTDLSLFDSENLEDIPNELKKHFKNARKEKFQQEVMELFKIKDTLKITEVIIGYYRKYKVIKSKAQLISVLNSLIDKKRIVKLSSSDYRIAIPANYDKKSKK